MARSIYILCGDATYNRGDRGNLAAQVTLLRSQFPDVRITIDSYRPEIDQGWYDADVIRRSRFLLSREQIQRLRAADVVVWGGGALVVDNGSRIKIPYWILIMGFIKWVLRKPIMAWAQGLVVNTPLGARLGKIILNWTDIITVRDENSMATLKRIGAVRPPHYMTADPAVLVRPSAPEVGRRILTEEGIMQGSRPVFAIANTFCPFHYDTNDIIPYMIAKPLGLRQQRNAEGIAQLKQALARLADGLIEKYDCQLVFLPTYPAPWEDDLEHFQQMRMMTHQTSASILQHDDYSPADYLSIWHHLACVVTIPMHHSIFSTVMRVPCIALYYEPKGRDFFTALGAEDRLVDVNRLFAESGTEHVLQTVHTTLRDWETIDLMVQQRLTVIQDRAKQNVMYLDRLFDAQRTDSSTDLLAA